VRDRLRAAGADIGDIQRLGDTWSLFFRDPDGMELEVCTPVEAGRTPSTVTEGATIAETPDGRSSTAAARGTGDHAPR
jgi:hypothetical protein